MAREIKTYPVYGRTGNAILIYVTLDQAIELITNGSAKRVQRHGFALRLTGHKFNGDTGQVRDLSCYMDERVIHANACGGRRARGMTQAWAVNHAGLCPVATR
jgi:hypothetical protein